MTMRAILGLAAAAALAGGAAVGAHALRLQPPNVVVGGQPGTAPRGAVRAAVSDDAAADPGTNLPYDGRFAFARIRFEPAGGGFGFGGRADPKWNHDFPRADRNFARILTEVSSVHPRIDGVVLGLDDPDLFKYPVIYLCEPGFWSPTDEEAANLRAYLLKGGFIIFDDFFGYHWDNFAQSMRKVLPQARPVPLDVSHPIFDSFYHIVSLEMQSYGRNPPEFLGIYEDNDPTKRLLAVIDYNNDIGEDWEWSDTGTMPVELSNQAYKLGVNYVVYAMTH